MSVVGPWLWNFLPSQSSSWASRIKSIIIIITKYASSYSSFAAACACSSTWGLGQSSCPSPAYGAFLATQGALRHQNGIWSGQWVTRTDHAARGWSDHVGICGKSRVGRILVVLVMRTSTDDGNNSISLLDFPIKGFRRQRFPRPQKSNRSTSYNLITLLLLLLQLLLLMMMALRMARRMLIQMIVKMIPMAKRGKRMHFMAMRLWQRVRTVMMLVVRLLG